MTFRRLASKRSALLWVAGLLLVAPACFPGAFAQPADPLPSWNDCPVKQAILKFVREVTTTGTPTFVPVPQRIATFDNDGTLWVEQPMYTQMTFALDRIKVMAPQHPEWKTQEPFKSVLQGNLKGVMAGGEKAIFEIIATTHSGMTTATFAKEVTDWLATAKHPRFHRPYTELIYQPMVELLIYLRANGFKTFIVSGGGIDFMRPWTEKAYGIPPEQVVGSVGETKLEVQNGEPVLVKLPKIDLVDDKSGKPVGIERFIGRRPILAFGNSDGDQQMLEWTAAGSGASFMGLVHHTDAVREYAYDRKSPVGTLNKAWDEAVARGWSVVDMKNDWKVIFPPEPKN
jgi:phosphoglycolate phosphatase-like HAD superfamily hydrolase